LSAWTEPTTATMPAPQSAGIQTLMDAEREATETIVKARKRTWPRTGGVLCGTARQALTTAARHREGHSPEAGQGGGRRRD
jgi:hypothetical protein